MKKSRIIVSPYISDDDRALLARISRKGGVERLRADGKVWGILSAALFVGMLITPSTLPVLNIVLFVSFNVCGLHFYHNYYRLLGRIRKMGVLVTTTDPEVISLDEEWLKYIALQPEEWRQGEDQKRFMIVRRLAETPAGAERTEEILQLRRKVQQRDESA